MKILYVGAELQVTKVLTTQSSLIPLEACNPFFLFFVRGKTLKRTSAFYMTDRLALNWKQPLVEAINSKWAHSFPLPHVTWFGLLLYKEEDSPSMTAILCPFSTPSTYERKMMSFLLK